MKKRCFRLFAGVLALAVMMTYTVIWNPSQAKMTKSKDVKKVEVTNVQGKNITLGKGKKLKLSVNVILKKGSKASKAVKFASSKKSVVTVSKKGVLKAKKIGKAKITVKSKANPAKQVKFTVTVAKKNVLIKKISMKKKLTLHMPLVEEEDDSDDDSDTSSDSSEEDGYYDEDGDFIYYTSGRASDTDYKVDFLTVRTPKNRTDSTVSDGKVVLLDNENTDSGDSTNSTDGSGSTDTAVTDTIVTDAATVQLSFRLLVNSDNAFKVAAAKQVAASWNSLNGVNVTVDEEPYDTYVSMLQSGSFDAYYGETQLTPDFDLRPLLSPQGGLNYGSYSSEDMSNAITAYRSGENTEGLYTTFLNEMPLIPLAFERQQVVLRSGLINHFNPAPYNAFAGQENWVKP